MFCVKRYLMSTLIEKFGGVSIKILVIIAFSIILISITVISATSSYLPERCTFPRSLN